MNYLVLSNRALLLENHGMLFHGNEKIKTNKPQKHKFKKQKEKETLRRFQPGWREPLLKQVVKFV